MLNQEKHIRVFKKVKLTDLKSAEYYEDIDYSNVGFPTPVINEVVKEPTQINTIRRIEIETINTIVAFIVLAVVLVNLVLFKIIWDQKKSCSEVSLKNNSAYDEMPKINIDCVVSEWSDWMRASDTHQLRGRIILVEPSASGKQCPRMTEGRRMDSRIKWQTDSTGRIEFAYDCDKHGNDNEMIEFPMASEDCGSACRNHYECTHFHWSQGLRNGTCILKRGSVSVRDFTHISTTEKSSQLCGLVKPLFEWKNNVAKGCDFRDNDLSNQGIEKADQCLQLCERTPECTHFTFNSENNNCLLKKGSINKSSAIVTEWAECGLVANNFENKHLGCHGDSDQRDMHSVYYQAHLSNTLEDCFQFCRSHDHRYAGLQYGSECWCSDTYGKYGTSNRCNKPCTGNAEQICGGPMANSVYDVSPKIRSDRRKRSATKPNQKPLKFVLSSIEISENELSM